GGGWGEMGVGEAEAEGEVGVVGVREVRAPIAQPDHRRRRPPRFGKETDLERMPHPLRLGRVRRREPGERQDDGRDTEAERDHREPGAASANKARMSARAGGLAQSLGPTPRATARASRPMTNVVGSPITPYSG